MELANVSEARLPRVYEQAKSALQTCVELDECKTWGDKAQAMASYARQAKDQQLRKMADRIQARAIRRCGELLQGIEPGKGGRPRKTRVGADPSFDGTKRDGTVPLSRTQAARDAGLSKRQQKTAMRVASVPEKEFETAVESDDPPTVTQLAEYAKKKGVPKEFNQATRLYGDLESLAEFCNTHESASVVQGFLPEEKDDVKEWVRDITWWLDDFMNNLG